MSWSDQLEPEPPPDQPTNQSSTSLPTPTPVPQAPMPPETTPEPYNAEVIKKGITTKQITALIQEIKQLRRYMRQYRKKEAYTITDSTAISAAERAKFNQSNAAGKYPFIQQAQLHPPNLTRAQTIKLPPIRSRTKIDPGLETSSHERVSLISREKANELVQRGAFITRTNERYRISTSQAGNKPMTKCMTRCTKHMCIHCLCLGSLYIQMRS